jgi:hypothetical protein
MRKLIILAALFLCLPSLVAQASAPPPFQLICRQENVAVDRFNTRSDLMITVVNQGGAEARDIILSIPGPNPYLFIDSPVILGTVPAGRQAEIMHKSSMPNEMVALADPADQLTWRIEYTDEVGERVAVEVVGISGQ